LYSDTAGTYEGNFYGTPRPPRSPPEISLNEKINDLNKSGDEALPNGWEMARTNSGMFRIFRNFFLIFQLFS